MSRPRIILGINTFHADSSACLFINNKLEFGVEEERINRTKHWAGLPINSIKACLSYKNLKISDITDIAINTNPPAAPPIHWVSLGVLPTMLA